MRKKILALSLTTVMALSALTGVLVTRNANVEPMTNETAMLVDDEESGEVLAANYTQEDLDRASKEALDAINKIRKENGLSPLKWGGNFISDIRAEEITEIFSHYSESLSVDKMSAENCARTNSLNAQHVVDLWMNSAGHKKNILFNIPTYAQISVVEKNGRYYWVNCFFSPENYEDRLAEYESGMYRHREETETKPQPSSAAAEVKQEEQKPATEVKQETKPEVKQETKSEVKEEQKPVITPEVKQEEVKPEVKEEQKPVPSSVAEEQRSIPEISPETKTSNESTNKGSGAIGTKEGSSTPGLTIYYDKETDQRYEIVVSPGQSREEAFREQVPQASSNSLRSSRNESRSNSTTSNDTKGLAPVGGINEYGDKVLNRTTETGPNGETVTKEDLLTPDGMIVHFSTW